MSVTAEDIRSFGIIGAGGAGFPTYVKAGSKAEILILNAAECEPLLHKDKELLKNFPDKIIEGMKIMMSLIGAKEGIIGIKEKYTDVIELLLKKIPKNIKIFPMGDYYPAGDEFILVYAATGRIIPPGGLPLNVGCVVDNVETIFNIAMKQPVTKKYLTVAGSVKNPSTICVPLGVSFKECIEIVGGATEDDISVLEGGLMMGRYIENLSSPVTKTTGGLIVLPYEHPIAKKYRRNEKQINMIGKAACDQCSFCTEYCPRYLIGHPIQPHLAMRALGFAKASDTMVIGTLFCCECNLCSFYSCPEDLDPKNVCVFNKGRLRKANAKWASRSVKAHPLQNARKVPLKRLFAKLSLKSFTNKGTLISVKKEWKKVVLPLKQGLGAASEPIVKIGDIVREGDIIAAFPKDKLGVVLHSSINGKVAEISDKIIIEAL